MTAAALSRWDFSLPLPQQLMFGKGNCRSISGAKRFCWEKRSRSSCNSPRRGSGSPSELGTMVIFRSERLRGTIDCPDDRCYVSHYRAAGLNCFLLQLSVCLEWAD
ncbi:hypothetical protein Q8A67_020144 [Cirrhinus molitorella]|uniref:Uncharacterized protein n=1 Tax=Cirrhinus molitorella TaxID=172907 RepID=A0AA88TCL1_9TELE|nr:hypothetical protein Q8A67_020144 [Cirrhinus molitorella]